MPATSSDLSLKIEDLKKRMDVLERIDPDCLALALEDLETCIRSLQDELGRKGKEFEAENVDWSRTFRGLMAQSADRFFLQDRDLRYVWLSHEDAFGIPAKDIIGKWDFDIFPQQEAERLWDIKSEVLKTGAGVRIETHTTINGQEHFFDAEHRPWRGRKGEIFGVAIYARDVTSGKAAETVIGKMTKAVETAPTAILLTNLEGNIEYVNPSLLRMGGFESAPQILGQSVFEFTNDEGCSKLNEEIIPALFSDGRWQGEFPVLAKDRMLYITELICALVRDESGEPSYFLANFYDISERKRAEDALLLDEARLEALLKLNQMDEATLQEITDYALNAGVKLTSSKLGYLAFVDEEEKTLIMHSWSKEALEACRAHKQIIYPLEKTGLWGEAVRQRKAIITNDYSASPYRKGLPEGHLDVKRHLNVPVFDRGRIVAVAGVGNKEEPYNESDIRQLNLLMSGMWQIIQRHRTEEALKESQRTLSTLMGNLPGMAYRCRNDQDRTLLFVSNGCLELTGYRPHELIFNRSVSYNRLIHPDDREYVLEEVQEALAERIPFQLMYRIRSLEGTKWVWDKGQGIFSLQGELLFLEGFAIDITDRKLAEEALRLAHDELERRVEERTAWLLRSNEALHEEMAQHKKTEAELRRAQRAANAASQAKGDFLANMSHEIRTPMNAVIGMAGLLLDTDLTTEQKDYVETIKSSGDALLAVINDILDFSKIDQGKMKVEKLPFELEECIESSMAMVAAKAAPKGLKMSYSIDRQVPEVLKGDAGRLRQVLINLLSNAVKFTNEGTVEVLVRAGSRGEIHFEVRDTGIGMSEENMRKLFQPFSQLDASTSRRYGGTGLGLAISKRLVQLMGGKIWAESTTGKGSTFHFTVKADSDPGIMEETRLLGKRVLVAIDDQRLVESLETLFSRWGAKAVFANSSDEAEAIIRRDGFDVALVDERLDWAEEVVSRRGSLPVIRLSSIRREVGFGLQPHPIRILRLHAAIIEALTSAKAPSREGEKAGPSEPALHVLLAEDNPVNQKVALLMLKRLGYQADLAADGHEVLRALERQNYDIVLMDVQMPEIDGLEAARAIRSRKDIDQPAILAMTAYALEGDREKCLAAGMDGYIRKPVLMDDLRKAMEEMRKKKERER
ncbi:MAG: PAS domain S-box protein [Methanotrichaceae archaeon]|nr:PAS domain S-box protein [Methanotrichaceae archaeon]